MNPHNEAQMWRSSAKSWKQMYMASRMGALYTALPGLCCGIGVFTSTDAPGWLNAVAGGTIGTSAAVLLRVGASFWMDHRDRQVDRALAERLWREEDGRL